MEPHQSISELLDTIAMAQDTQMGEASSESAIAENSVRESGWDGFMGEALTSSDIGSKKRKRLFREQSNDKSFLPILFLLLS
jgi:hypothetical protein